jgi:hypothetical protein
MEEFFEFLLQKCKNVINRSKNDFFGTIQTSEQVLPSKPSLDIIALSLQSLIDQQFSHLFSHFAITSNNKFASSKKLPCVFGNKNKRHPDCLWYLPDSVDCSITWKLSSVPLYICLQSCALLKGKYDCREQVGWAVGFRCHVEGDLSGHSPSLAKLVPLSQPKVSENNHAHPRYRGLCDCGHCATSKLFESTSAVSALLNQFPVLRELSGIEQSNKGHVSGFRSFSSRDVWDSSNFVSEMIIGFGLESYTHWIRPRGIEKSPDIIEIREHWIGSTIFSACSEKLFCKVLESQTFLCQRHGAHSTTVPTSMQKPRGYIQTDCKGRITFRLFGLYQDNHGSQCRGYAISVTACLDSCHNHPCNWQNVPVAPVHPLI